MPQEKKNLNQDQRRLFNLEKVLNNVDGDREVFQTLVSIFVEESSYQMKEIREGIQSADTGSVEKAAHAVKGAVGNFAAQRAFEMASHLELLARQGKLNELPTAFSDLETEMDSLREALLRSIDQF